MSKRIIKTPTKKKKEAKFSKNLVKTIFHNNILDDIEEEVGLEDVDFDQDQAVCFHTEL